jgi:hypothetical protein
MVSAKVEVSVDKYSELKRLMINVHDSLLAQADVNNPTGGSLCG